MKALVKKQKKKRPLFADTPIARLKDDELGRSPFVKSLARTILQMQGDDSFVFGLCGPWGSGKSSVLSLVVQQLKTTRGKKAPAVIEFNPWWFSGRDQLLQAFLGQLGAVLGQSEKGDRVTKLGKRLSTLGKLLRPLGWIPGAGALKDVGDVLGEAGDATSTIGERIKGDIHAIREEINVLLRDFNRRIVVVMDDIDRLTAHEMAQLFLIVKAVADFPNTVYLLAFDPDVVGRAISDSLDLDGNAYLEKIVQVQIELPVAGPVSLQQMFLRHLGSLVDERHVNEMTHADFSNLFHDGIKSFLQTPRSVKRLINVLGVLYPGVEGEVYWPDFLAIISLMVSVPRAFRTIRDNADRFTGSGDSRNTDRDGEKKFHEGWLEQIPEDARKATKDLVCRLFPRVSAAMGRGGFSRGFESKWRADLRACSVEMFPRYFQLSVPTGAISEAEWSDIMSLLSDSREFDARVDRLCREKGPHGFTTRAKEFLERAQLFAKHQANVEQAQSLFRAILRLADKLVAVEDSEMEYLISIDNKLRISWALQEALVRIDDQTARESFLEGCVQGEAELFTIVNFVWFLGAQHGKFESEGNEPHEPRFVSEECVDRLVQSLLKRIEESANAGSLAAHPKAMLIAREWCAFDGESKPKEWVASVAKDDRVLVRFVGQLRSVARSHGVRDRVARVHQRVDAAYLLKWFDGLDLRTRCQTLLDSQPEWLGDEDLTTLRLLVGSIDEDGTAVEFLRRRG